jgi:hypothetical protein
MIDLYNNGDIGTLDSTLELKDKILAAEAKFCYKDSKGFKKALYRQHFLELGLIADDMNYDEIISTWQAIKGGNNTFAGESNTANNLQSSTNKSTSISSKCIIGL